MNSLELVTLVDGIARHGRCRRQGSSQACACMDHQQRLRHTKSLSGRQAEDSTTTYSSRASSTPADVGEGLMQRPHVWLQLAQAHLPWCLTPSAHPPGPCQLPSSRPRQPTGAARPAAGHGQSARARCSSAGRPVLSARAAARPAAFLHSGGPCAAEHDLPLPGSAPGLGCCSCAGLQEHVVKAAQAHTTAHP